MVLPHGFNSGDDSWSDGAWNGAPTVDGFTSGEVHTSMTTLSGQFRTKVDTVEGP